ncbi:MAG TPA: zinc ribbon domain-containing protein [Candidatus Angelobacter sp.]|nr:zinc ribbon domain-containing protein [Candidatus Angelobacter sp.]
MDQQNVTSCNVCKSSVAAGALFCTNCGARLPEPQAAATETQTVTEAIGKAPEVSLCIKCNAILEPQAMFCTTCGARVSAQGLDAPVIAGSGKTSVISPSAAAAPAMAATNSASANSASSNPAAQPEVKDLSTGLGQSSSALKPGVFIVIALVLIVGIAAAMLWMRPSAAKSNHVIILAPQQTSFTVEPNSSAQVAVSVQGDGGAGLSWKIAESYGGTVQAAGVTVHGSQFLYHATYHAGGTPGDYHIVASSAANSDSSVTILVHVER